MGRNTREYELKRDFFGMGVGGWEGNRKYPTKHLRRPLTNAPGWYTLYMADGSASSYSISGRVAIRVSTTHVRVACSVDRGATLRSYPIIN